VQLKRTTGHSTFSPATVLNLGQALVSKEVIAAILKSQGHADATCTDHSNKPRWTLQCLREGISTFWVMTSNL
jgi:hypothetical protein